MSNKCAYCPPDEFEPINRFGMIPISGIVPIINRILFSLNQPLSVAANIEKRALP